VPFSETDILEPYQHNSFSIRIAFGLNLNVHAGWEGDAKVVCVRVEIMFGQ
jgi:hypothetical protein